MSFKVGTPKRALPSPAGLPAGKGRAQSGPVMCPLMSRGAPIYNIGANGASGFSIAFHRRYTEYGDSERTYPMYRRILLYITLLLFSIPGG